MLCRCAYDLAFALSRLMTATTFEPSILPNAGPLFFSVTSPQPMNPHLISSFAFMFAKIIKMQDAGCRMWDFFCFFVEIVGSSLLFVHYFVSLQSEIKLQGN